MGTDQEVSIDQSEEELRDHQSATQDSAHHESSQSEDHAVTDQFDSADDQSDIVKLITGHERGRAIRRGKCSSLKLIDLISSVASSQLTNEIRNYLFHSNKNCTR